MSWTAPRVAAVGDVFTAAWVNEISGDLDYLRGNAGRVDINDTITSNGGNLIGHPSTAGVWLQAGSGTCSTSDGAGHFYEDVTFPVGFPTVATAVVAQAGVGSGGVTVDVNSVTTSGFRAISPQNGTTYYWVAVGN